MTAHGRLRNTLIAVVSLFAFGCSGPSVKSGQDAPKGKVVTVQNFVRAETDLTMDRYVKQGGFGKFVHIRQPTPLDKQDVIRMNRDTLYSLGVFDLTEPVTISNPDSGKRFMSMMLVSQDHSILPAIYDPGEHTITQEQMGTRYVVVIFRTLVNANDPEDIKIANALQDQIKVTQANVGSFEIPEWDEVSLGVVRDAINVLAATMKDTSGMLGNKKKLDPIQHLLGTAMGWGGNPKQDAVYVNVFPEQNDGSVPHALTVKDVPVDAFWSITLYNSSGFMEKNSYNANSINNLTAKKTEDGSVTVHFGGDSKSDNFLPIMNGWNYIVRLYRPRQEILDGTWKFPDPQPVK